MDRTIPCKSLIMRCDSFLDIFCEEPEGITIRTYRCGDEKAWAELECEIGEFKDTHEAEEYFNKKYGTKQEKRDTRCLFACTQEGNIVGSCIAWNDRKWVDEVASLHCLVVKEGYQNQGIGKALLYEAMRKFLSAGELPVYLHTQTWSYKAIHLFSQNGFFLLKRERIANDKNEFKEAVPILKEYLSKNAIVKLLHDAEECDTEKVWREEEKRRIEAADKRKAQKERAEEIWKMSEESRIAYNKRMEKIRGKKRRSW